MAEEMKLLCNSAKQFTRPNSPTYKVSLAGVTLLKGNFSKPLLESLTLSA